MQKLRKSQRRAAEDLLRSARAAKNVVLVDRALSHRAWSLESSQEG